MPKTAPLALLALTVLVLPTFGNPEFLMTRPILDQSLAKGREFLLNSQKPEGNFVYQYDFTAKREIPGISPVRQAGALWGLALLHRDHPTERTSAALDRGFAFFEKHSRVTGGDVPGPGETVHLQFRQDRTRLYVDGWLATEPAR